MFASFPEIFAVVYKFVDSTHVNLKSDENIEVSVRHSCFYWCPYIYFFLLYAWFVSSIDVILMIQHVKSFLNVIFGKGRNAFISMGFHEKIGKIK